MIYIHTATILIQYKPSILAHSNSAEIENVTVLVIIVKLLENKFCIMADRPEKKGNSASNMNIFVSSVTK